MALDSQPSAAAANRFSILNYEQVLRLVSLMDSKVTLAAGCFSVLHLVQCVRSKLNRSGVQVRNTRLNGGAATFVIGGDAQSYNDVDIIFDVDLPHAEDTLELIRQAVFATLDDLHEFSAQSCRSALSASCKVRDFNLNLPRNECKKRHKLNAISPRRFFKFYSFSIFCEEQMEFKFYAIAHFLNPKVVFKF